MQTRIIETYDQAFTSSFVNPCFNPCSIRGYTSMSNQLIASRDDVQAKSKRTATLPSQLTFAFRKNASANRSVSSTSISIVSPGRTGRLNRTSFIRVATGTASMSAAAMRPDKRTAPACIAASHSNTPGTSGNCGIMAREKKLVRP